MSPLVSVIVTTYNHENFIEKSLNSILEQKTSFEVEIMLGEDDSEDATRPLVKKMTSMYPGRISLTLQDRKNVIRINGRETGRYNFIDLLSRSSGKYIAICEGDDFWTEPRKLHKQVEFMEANPDYSMCFHDAGLVDAEDNELDKTYCRDRIKEGQIDLAEFIDSNLAPTCSTLYRKSAICPPQLASNIRAYDWVLIFIAASKGSIFYMDSNWARYRSHPGGVWQRMNTLQCIISEKQELAKINRFLGYKFHGQFCRSMAHRELRVSQIYRQKQHPIKSVVHWLLGINLMLLKPKLQGFFNLRQVFCKAG